MYDVGDYDNNDSDGAGCNLVPKPTAFADTTTGPRNTLQTKNLLTNDTVVSSSTGVSYPLVASSIRLCKPQPLEVAPNCTVAPGQSISVSGVGSYSISATGVVSFMPAQDFTGTTSPISYQVTDTNGNTVNSTYTPEVLGNVPFAVDDYSSGSYDVVQTINVPANDYRSSAGALDLTSVRLCSDEQNVPASCTLLTLIVANQGTYTVNPTTGVIEDARFKTYGCGSAIASSSLVTEWVKGKTLDEAAALKNSQIAEELALPPVKIHCSILAEDAIKAAVDDYKKKHLN
jgi:CshA-type fibril repeat protein